MDYEQALLDPAGVFAAPGDVCDEPSLTLEQKIRILRRWEYDAREMEVAEEENMLGGEPAMLDAVLEALHRLTSEVDVDAPTKQGGE